jgi:hypothetical protein
VTIGFNPTVHDSGSVTGVLDGQASTRTALSGQTSMTIGGALTYQACDDRLCYNPRGPARS